MFSNKLHNNKIDVIAFSQFNSILDIISNKNVHAQSILVFFLLGGRLPILSPFFFVFSYSLRCFRLWGFWRRGSVGLRLIGMWVNGALCSLEWKLMLLYIECRFRKLRLRVWVNIWFVCLLKCILRSSYRLCLLLRRSTRPSSAFSFETLCIGRWCKCAFFFLRIVFNISCIPIQRVVHQKLWPTTCARMVNNSMPTMPEV